MMRKRAQAAMEFLMTYGWAILAAVIVVGVLWYMIGDPTNLVGNSFKVSTPFTKSAMVASATTDVIQVEFLNGGAEEVNITSVSISNCGANTTSTTIATGASTVFSVNCSAGGNPLDSGDRLNSDVVISYLTDGSSLQQQATGTITGRVP